MKTLAIVQYPEKVLKRKAGEAKPSTDIQNLVPQMIDAMYKNEGIGLAAPQIGISKRVIIVETSQDPRAHKEQRKQGTPGKPIAFLNPTITHKSKKTDTQEEGCLSLPGIFVPVKRSETVELMCTTPDGQSIKVEAAGLIARIFQHEVDHLNGKLIIDHLSPVKRLKLRKELREMQQKNK